MPNIINSSGLQTKTSAELITDLTTAFESIYGPDINLDADSPDGQMMRIFIQSVLDLEDLLTQIYNSFDPDLAYGNVLDQRVAINGIQRKAGTYSTTNITIVTTQSVTLQGLNSFPDDPYTISDNAGTEWYLVNTTSLGIGTFNVTFRARNPGAVLTIPNTITVPVTIVLGVQSVNNPNPILSVGLNEETDAELKVRRQQSVALSSQGYFQSLLASINNINGVTTAIVYENNTNTTDIYGVEGNSIWVIVGGTVADADVANAIYTKRNAGCGIYATNTGTTRTFVITQADGTFFTVRWDQVAQENLWVKFNATSLNGVNPPDVALIQSELPNLLTPGVGEKVNINTISALVQQIDPNAVVIFPTASGLSLDNVTYSSIITPSFPNRQLVTASVRILITVV